MSNSWLKKWTHEKVELALRLNNGDCGGSYAEAVIILCSVLSGISADVWPGRNRDRKRFVELLVKFTDTSFSCQKVSVPLLVSAVRDNGNIKMANSLKQDLMPPSEMSVVTGDDVDETVDELFKSYHGIDLTLLKRNSHACVLYEEVRSGFVHEYRPGVRSESRYMGSSRQDSSIRYINRVKHDGKVDRLIYFNVSWLASLVDEVVSTLSQSDPIPKFDTYNSWWLDN
jgi:hypothetical protein